MCVPSGFLCTTTLRPPIGRILVCWDPNVISLKVLDQSNQFIHCEVQTIDGNNPFLTTFVYGSNNYLERQDLWHSLPQGPIPFGPQLATEVSLRIVLGTGGGVKVSKGGSR